MAIDEKDVYSQLAEDFRSLNQLFWNIPTIAMTVNGGIFVAIASLSIGEKMQSVLFSFLVVCNIGFIFMVYRLRVRVMHDILSRMRKLDGQITNPGSFTIAYIFMFFFFVAGFFSFYGALNTHDLLPSKMESKKSFCLLCVVDQPI